MAKGTSKWLLGCGIGCGVVVLIVILIAASGLFFIRSTIKDFDEVIAARQQLEERYGQVDQFTPAASGALPADRMELFLSVRDSMRVVRDDLARSFTVLYSADRRDDEGKRSASTWQLIKTGFGVAGQMSDFFRARNRVLLDLGMGLGEYTYIYVISYYAWLGHSPTESPEYVQMEIDPQTGEYLLRDDKGGGSREISGSATPKRRLCHNLRSMLGNQLAALPATDAVSADAGWRDRLSEEIERLQNDAMRLPWQDGLPDQTAESLAPYRARLEESYNLVTNMFELSRSRKQGWSIKAE